MSGFELLAIGEAMAELRRGPDTGFAVGFAGDTFNTAVYAARVLGPNSVGYYTRIGSDPLSDGFVQLAKDEGVDCSSIAKDGQKNIGIYSVATDGAGERSFSYWRADSAARLMFSDGDISLPPARIYYLSGITLAILAPDARQCLMDFLAAKVRSGDAHVAFDSNYRPQLWADKATAQQVIGHMWELADIALPSLDDEMDLFEEDADTVTTRFAQKSWRACAIKRGEDGPISPSLAADQYPEFLPAAKVVDTTAAGDSFNAGYLSALLQGEDEAVCLQRGHDLAARVVGGAGAIVSVDE